MEAFNAIDSYGNCEASNDDHLLEYRHFVHQESVSSVMTQTRFEGTFTWLTTPKVSPERILDSMKFTT